MSKAIYAVISNHFRYPDGEVLGQVYSKHKTPEAAWKAVDKRNRAHRKANPGLSLDLTVIKTSHFWTESWNEETHARGPFVERAD